MSIEALKNQNRDLIKKDLNDLRNKIDKGQKKTEEKEVLDSITASIVYEKFLENIAEIKNSNNPEERQEKIKSIKDTFSEDWTIIYKDENWWIKEIKDIEDFLNKIATWEITINFLIDIEKYVKKWAITLEKEVKDGIDYIKIKKVQLNAGNIK